MAKGNPNPKTEHLRPFTTEGKYKKLSRKMLGLRLPPELDDYVRAKENKHQWLIEAVEEKYKRELLDFLG